MSSTRIDLAPRKFFTTVEYTVFVFTSTEVKLLKSAKLTPITESCCTAAVLLRSRYIGDDVTVKAKGRIGDQYDNCTGPSGIGQLCKKREILRL